MIPKEIIELAIKGGWDYSCKFAWNEDNPEEDRVLVDEAGTILDPTFWQALGKAKGWKSADIGEDICFMCGAAKDDKVECEYSSKHRYAKDESLKNACKFFALLLTSSPTKPFWDDIMKLGKE